MEDPKRQLTERLIQLLERLFTQVRPPFPREERELDLTMSQFHTLRLLSQGPRRMSDVAGYLGVTLPSATSMIDRLVSKGLVERGYDLDDRRVVTCRLSARGQDHVERFWRMGRMKAEMLAKALSAQDLETVVRALGIIATALNRESEGSPLGVPQRRVGRAVSDRSDES